MEHAAFNKMTQEIVKVLVNVSATIGNLMNSINTIRDEQESLEQKRLEEESNRSEQSAREVSSLKSTIADLEKQLEEARKIQDVAEVEVEYESSSF
jgi:predicted RNase H-like nuclease (RuvC/YqgF family)